LSRIGDRSGLVCIATCIATRSPARVPGHRLLSSALAVKLHHRIRRVAGNRFDLGVGTTCFSELNRGILSQPVQRDAIDAGLRPVLPETMRHRVIR